MVALLFCMLTALLVVTVAVASGYEAPAQGQKLAVKPDPEMQPRSRAFWRSWR